MNEKFTIVFQEDLSDKDFLENIRQLKTHKDILEITNIFEKYRLVFVNINIDYIAYIKNKYKTIESMEPDGIKKALDKLKPELPKELENQDLAPLKNCIQAMLKDIRDDGYYNSEFRVWIFECALRCIYGNDIFKWMSENGKGGI